MFTVAIALLTSSCSSTKHMEDDVYYNPKKDSTTKTAAEVKTDIINNYYLGYDSRPNYTAQLAAFHGYVGAQASVSTTSPLPQYSPALGYNWNNMSGSYYNYTDNFFGFRVGISYSSSFATYNLYDPYLWQYCYFGKYAAGNPYSQYGWYDNYHGNYTGSNNGVSYANGWNNNEWSNGNGSYYYGQRQSSGSNTDARRDDGSSNSSNYLGNTNTQQRVGMQRQSASAATPTGVTTTASSAPAMQPQQTKMMSSAKTEPIKMVSTTATTASTSQITYSGTVKSQGNVVKIVGTNSSTTPSTGMTYAAAMTNGTGALVTTMQHSGGMTAGTSGVVNNNVKMTGAAQSGATTVMTSSPTMMQGNSKGTATTFEGGTGIIQMTH